MKICTKCGQTKPLDQYWSAGKGFKRGSCKTCYYYGVKHRFLKRLQEIYGKLCCQVCKYDKNLSALEFHHVDSYTKDVMLSRLQTASFKRLKAEAEKCVILCANCHREIHHPNLGIDFLEENE